MGGDLDKYAVAGVNIDAAEEAVRLIKQHARSTFGPNVVSDIGLFGGLFQLSGYENPVLVSSVDGVGTKLKIAIALDKHDSIGIDLVNHCVNDIMTCGAEPLFFLDYLSVGKLKPQQVESIVSGLAIACRESGISLIGGETAEMPALYAEGDYDLAGFITGVVERDKIINGASIEDGDAVLGLPSSGLHTNGYSLVRKLFDVELSNLNKMHPELGRTLGQELLQTHRCYYQTVKPILPFVRGMAHITGGGLIDNVPRILPDGLGVNFYSGSWSVLPIFKLIQSTGDIEDREMYRVFNMGLGMVIISSPGDVDKLLDKMPESRVVGKVVSNWKERVRID